MKVSSREEVRERHPMAGTLKPGFLGKAERSTFLSQGTVLYRHEVTSAWLG